MQRLVFSIVLVARAAMCQQPASAASEDHAIIQQLLQRVQALEAQVRELQAQRGPAHSPAAPIAHQETPDRRAETGPGAQRDVLAEEASRGVPAMKFRGFGDVQHFADARRSDTHSFALGEFDLFISSKLSNRLSVVAEAVIAAEENFGPRKITVSNEFEIELERFLLQYSANNYLNLSFGRYHTAIGFYNTAYHHSAWLQTATGRPFLFAFEDQGGILPIHSVGVSATGRIPSGPLGLRYVAELGNGRASRSPLDPPVQTVRDENNGKAVNFALLARPEGAPGFQAGFSVYRDRLTPQNAPKIGQTILALHAVYQGPKWELLNEGVLLRNAPQTARVVHTAAFYTQVSRRFGPLQPYFRYEYLNAPAGDPVFADVGRLQGPSLGLRYDFSEFAAFKIQYDRSARRTTPVNGFSTQLCFTF